MIALRAARRQNPAADATGIASSETAGTDFEAGDICSLHYVINDIPWRVKKRIQ